MAQNPIPRLVQERLARWNAQHPNHQVDPEAARAVGLQEGYSGGIGDNGHAFGPFQLNNAGGVLTGMFPGQSPQQLQAWAASPAGIDFAVGRIGQVAGGLHGRQAVDAIVRRFERPANPDREVTNALAAYGRGGAGPGVLPPGPAAATMPSPQPGLQQPLQGAPVNLAGLLSALGGASSSGDYTGFYARLGAAAQQRQQPQQQPGVRTLPAMPGQTAPVATLPYHGKTGVPVADLTSEGGPHPTMGLAGYPARDYFAPAGSGAVAPVAGKVVRLSGHDPRLGPVEGPHGPLGWSVYIQGTDGHEYYLTHLGSRSVQVGQTVKAGQPIGTVANYAKYGTPSHIHMGVH